jgi:hypothetical protein
MKSKTVPKHRKLMIKALELTLKGKGAQAKKVLNQAQTETTKFYSK